MPEIVYLDVCCFKRPFDDARSDRIRREAEAVAEILEAAQQGRVRLVRSPAHDFENDRNPREDRRLATQIWLDTADVRVDAGELPERRSRELTQIGFAPLDALHIAFAEQARAKWFATTDDGIVKRAAAHSDKLRVTIVGPDEIDLAAGGRRE